jgi:hypothetical protein
MKNRPAFAIALGLIALSAVAGCATTYYAVWQKLGYEKRDILVSRVKDARDDQEAAKQQFKTTLQQFEELTNYNGGDLETEYNKLNTEYNSAVSRADAVHKRIASVDKVAHDLFDEWQTEIGEYTDENLKHASEQKLAQTKDRYATLIAAMRSSESKMQPVLNAFHDQVLFLKHILNADAIASLKTTAAGIDSDVSKLIDDMNASIKESDSFIDQMNQEK